LNGICAPWWKDWPTPRAIIFDLDNCLASAGEIGQDICAPAFAAIRKASRGILSDERLNAAFADCFVDAIDESNRQGKQGLFELISSTYRLDPTMRFITSRPWPS
jgi:hypothetical protein